MGDVEEDNREQRSSSDPKVIPKQSLLKLDYKSSQCASFVSQRSSSIETYGSSSPTNSSDGKFLEPEVQGNPDNSASCAVSDDSTLEADSDKTAVNRDNASTDSQHWLCDNESLPSSLLHPEHQSTPVKGCDYLPAVSEEGGDAVAVVSGENATEEGATEDVFLPGDLHTPILGFETMEERSRFTVRKKNPDW